MSTSPSSVNPSDATPLDPDPTGQDPSAQDPAAKQKMLLQSAIFEVTREAAGKSLSDISDMLQQEFSRRGVEAPTSIWLDSVASAAFYGEPYIIDYPAALAAEAAVNAPNPEVRERLASRRELRNEKLPAGTFPPASDWVLDGSEVTGQMEVAGPGPRSRALVGSTHGVQRMLAAVAVGTAILLVTAAIRAVRNARRRTAGRTTPGGA